MRKITFALLLGIFAMACSESNSVEPAPDNNKTEIDIEKIADCVVAVSEEIDPLFTECETIEELATHLDEIKNMEGVADAWVTNTALFVETEGGFPLSWLYTPDFNADEDFVSSRSIKDSLYALKVLSEDISNKNEYRLMGQKKVGIVNPISHYEKHPESEYVELGKLFSNAGFQVSFEIGEEADINFFSKEFATYDIIFLITHGMFDGNTHWLMTGETIWKKIFLSIMINPNRLKDLAIVTHTDDGVVFRNWAISEEFIKNKMRDFNQDAIVFNCACQSLKGNNSLAKVLKEKNVRAYLGYDDTNCQGYNAGITFYKNMLKGMTVEQALKQLPSEYLIDDCPTHKIKPHKAYLKSALPEGNNMYIICPIVTLDATEIKSTSVTLNAQINGWNNAEFGFCYSKDNESPTVENGIKYNRIDYSNEESSKLNFHSVDLDGLESSTTYYYRAYMRINDQYIYGEVKSFTTAVEKVTGTAEAIDLGLSVKWASHNVGATKPEEFGNHYAWGETEVKEKYTMFNYKYLNWSTGGVVNIGTEISGTKYDVATVKWGGNWRMPTADEMLELTNNCEWTDSICNGVRGKKVTGVNGNSIFLPAAGAGAPALEQGFTPNEVGVYWTGTLDTSYSEDLVGLVVTRLHFEYGYFDDVIIGTREEGLSVRPVCE